MFIQFQYLIMTSILISIALYINETLKRICKNSLDIELFIEKMIKIATVSVLGTGLLILKGIIAKSFRFDNSLYYIQRLILTGILFMFIFISLRIFWSKYIKYDALIKSKIFIVIIISSILIPIKSFELLYYFSIAVFIVIIIRFIYKTLFCLKMKANIGIYCLIGGSIAITLSTILSFYYRAYFFNTFSLALMTFIMFGFFLFYLSYFLKEFENKYEQLLIRDEIIKEKNKKIEEIMVIDDVTGIKNQVAFKKKLLDLDVSVYVGLLNIHDFMRYNKLFGFDRGNLILKELALTLISINPESIDFYRYYSDKFLVIFNTNNYDDVLIYVNKIQKAIENMNYQGIHLNTYIGLYLIQFEEIEMKKDYYSKLICSLETASSIAKTYKNSTYAYIASDHENFNKIMTLELKLINAINSKMFIVYYQPQIEKNTGEIRSFEALIRWKDEDKFISPAEFIPLAERKGFMSAITKQVIDKVFADYISETIFFEKKVSINLSPDQLIEEEFLEYVENKLEEYNIDPNNIIFEITETSLFNDVEKATETLEELKTMGFQISLDDFGNGYSSVYRFSKHDIDEIKFDKAFIDDIDNPKTFNTIRKMAELFKSFKMRVVLEGLETFEQLKKIEDFDIDLIQGYYFCQPMSVEDLKEKYEKSKNKGISTR